MQEKAERIEELEKENDKKRKDLIKKFQVMEAKKEKFENIKQEKILQEKLAREKKFHNCQKMRKEIQYEDNQDRLDILDYQYNLLRKSKKKDSLNELKRINANEQTVINQMNLEKNLTLFNKRMNELKDKSVYKKTPEERYKIYRDIKREEARKKKEEEEKLLNKQ